MRINVSTDTFKRRIAFLLFAVLCGLLPVENAFALPDLSFSTSFTPAETGRTYMDIGGTWNGSSEVTTGDRFNFTITNSSSVGTTSAYDIRDIPVTVPTGFVLASSSVSVLDSGCSNNMSAFASQSGAGNPVTINILSNTSTEINPGCSYEFRFRLETDITANPGNQSLGYSVTYNTVNNDNASSATVTTTQSIAVNAGGLSVNKSGPAAPVADGATVSFSVVITNTGNGGLFDVRLTDVLGSHFDPLSLVIIPPGFPSGSVISANQYEFDYLDPLQTVILTVQVDVDVDPTITSCPDLVNTANITERTTDQNASDTATVEIDLSAALSLTHDGNSFCELCGDGTVRLLVQNTNSVTLTDVVVTENLLASGLNYVPGTTQISIDGGGLVPRADPTGSATVFTWSSTQIPELANMYAATGSPPNSIEIYFDVRRPPNTEEDLTLAVRDIIASATYDDVCSNGPYTATPPSFLLPIQEPLPAIVKEGRNVEAGMNSGNYQPIVYGHENDDIIWRVNIQNGGQADLQDLLIADTVGGNFVINYICFNEGSAETTAIANNGGSAGPGCVAFDPTYPPTALLDVAGPGNTNYFYVGRILPGQCSVQTNSADIEWGCEADSSTGVGGILATSIPTATNPAPGSTQMSTEGSGALDAGSVTQVITGVDGGPEVGSRGIVTITVENDTGGTIRNVVLDNAFPSEYVVDITAPITFNYTYAYGAVYDGVADEMTHNIDLDPADILTNTNPRFTIHSGTDQGDEPLVDYNLFRHGDLFTISFEIVLINTGHFDRAADIDATPEDDSTLTTIAPLVPTDPDNGDNNNGDVNTWTLNNNLTITYDDTCTFASGITYLDSQAFEVDVEDLDLDMSSVIYVLTDTGSVNLDVDITNNGGHVASNFFIYIAFGEAMTVVNNDPLLLPTGCDFVSAPLSHPLWNVPDDIPQAPRAPTLVMCSDTTGMTSITPGTTRTLIFNVEKNAAATFDDLTFRADVIGEITLSNNNALVLPTPTAIETSTTPFKQITPVANNYTQDAFRSRVIGFNLTKSQQVACVEDPPAVPFPVPTLPPAFDTDVTIGEDCTFHIEAGGWFGFDTPGFALIAVEDVTVTDDLPDPDPHGGQGYISHTTTITTGILGLSLDGGAVADLDETNIDWSFNPSSGTGIIEKGQWFRTDITTRILNDDVDDRAAPNFHGQTSTNVARASFTAVFDTLSIDVYENRVPSIPGFPPLTDRTIDLTVTEPLLTVTKEVCNETLNGTGPSCSVFSDTLINDGDTNDSYIYKITIENAAGRAPAFDIISTDTLGLDAVDLMTVMPFDSDGLDNDGDGLDETQGDLDEAFISIGDTTLANGIAPVITVTNTAQVTSLPLLRIDGGDSVTFYFRVNPDPRIAPLQTITNNVNIQYDTLAGDFGNQNPPQIDNTPNLPDTDAYGRARIYNIADSVDIQMIPLVADPKAIIELSNTSLGGSPQEVVVGEEIRYQLTAQLPVANLRNFKIRDQLPAGVRCTEVPAINLTDDDAYKDAGFDPGGPPISTSCTSTGTNDYVEWDFGDQRLTDDTSPVFDFVVDFVARVENSNITVNGATITNGGGAVNPLTCEGGVAVCYVNEAGAPIALDFAPVSIVVREPGITLTKEFSIGGVALTPADTVDAGDVLTVTVTAENNTPDVAAYNLRVLDILVGTDLTYVGNISGTHPPDNVDVTTLGADQPIFSWDFDNADYEIGPGVIKTFTFDVSVDITAQPLERLDNTIQAIWDSIRKLDPATGLPIALSSVGLAADGTELGLRNGVLPNAGGTLNNYEAETDTFTSVQPLTMSKTVPDPAIVPTIGAHEHFRIEILLPEGTTHNLVVTDDLAVGNISYVLANNADFDITYTFEGIASINPPPLPAIPGPVEEAAFNSFPTVDTATTAIWDIGTVVTDQTAAPGTSAPRIIIDYYARANNELPLPSAVAGNTLRNSVDVDYTHGETSAAAPTLTALTPEVTVVEPVLTAGKASSNITSPGVAPDAGDVIEYTLSISNADVPNISTAYDVNIVDTLPPEMVLVDAIDFTPTAFINGSAVTGFVPTPAGAPGGPLIWGHGNGDDSLDIPRNETLVLTYRVVLLNTVEPNQVISNSVWFDWTSLDSASLFETDAYERTGAGCPTVTAPNTYCDTTDVPLTIIDDNTVLKSIIDDSYDVAPLSTAVDGTVRIGDTVSYQLAVTLQEGHTDNVSLQDTLPAGLEFVAVQRINGDPSSGYDPPASGAGSNFSYATIPATNVPSAGATGVLTWDLGSITNDAQGDATTDTIVIEYLARVVEDVLPHVASTTLTNTVDLRYIDGNGAASADPALTPRLRNIADLTVLQPIINSVTKLDRDGSHISGDPVVIATDIMNFQLQSCNTTGLAPAYGIDIVDNLPSQLDETSLVGPSNGPLQPDVRINGVLQTAGVDYVYTPPVGRGGQMEFVIAAPVNPNECVDIDFDIGFYTDFGGDQFWTNTVSVDEYWSLPADAGQQYLPAVSADFDMNNVANVVPPAKSLLSPVSAEATIGDTVVYRISVPATPANGALYDVVITDTLDDSLVFVSASDTSASNFTLTNNTVLPNQVSLSIDYIPAGQQAIIELQARVNNVATANAGDVFQNTASYSYAIVDSGVPINGGNVTTTNPLRIVEPTLTLNKSVLPATPPDAGDILTYTLVIDALGGAVGDNYSDAFDLSINDTLGLGLVYSGNPTIGGSALAAPVIAGDGITTPQSMLWDLANGVDIDVAEGNSITITYDVLVLDTVLANQALTNFADIRWTSLNGADANERDGSLTPAHNDYRTTDSELLTTPDANDITKQRTTDTSPAFPADNDVRIGDIIDFELRLDLQEGTSPNVVVTDILPLGFVFEETISINGDTTASYDPPASGAGSNFAYVSIPASSVPASGTTGVLSWDLGDIVNQASGDATTDTLVINYRVRVLNGVLPQANSIPLTNSVSFDYLIATGAAPMKTSSETMTVLQPDLIVVKDVVDASGDSLVVADELVTYTVEIANTGTTPAYDTVLQDIIPVGLRNGAATITMVSTELVAGTTAPVLNTNAVLTTLTSLAPVYDAVTGVATWDFDSGTADEYNIPAGQTLRIVYQVQADSDLSTGATLVNSAQVQLYYSLDDDDIPVQGSATGVAEIYGPSNTATASLNTQPPVQLDKQITVATASIGEPFTYTILVPATPMDTVLHDVRILDDLSASTADLVFVSVAKISGSQSWTPVNTGTATDLVIEDITNGIEISRGEQIEIELTVMLRDNAITNVAGLRFNNRARYTFNTVDGDNATVNNTVLDDITADMTVVEPNNINLTKTGPANLQFGTAGTFSLDVHNYCNPSTIDLADSCNITGPAYDLTIVDHLPDPAPGGMCDVPPTNFVAEIQDDAGVTQRSLVAGTDYITSFTTGTSLNANPTCTLTITMQSYDARIDANDHLIVNYDSQLDADNPDASTLTNYAAATQWFSTDDTSVSVLMGEIREYTRVLTDGTPSLLDHQDEYQFTVAAAVIDFRKEVVNVTTGQDPGSDASPGDTLRYTITMVNAGNGDANNVVLTDAIPTHASYVANSVYLNGLPVAQPDGGVSPLAAGVDISSSDLTPPLPTSGNGVLAAGETAILIFDVLLDPAIDSGTVIQNQAQLSIAGIVSLINSDDPTVLPDTEDPTETTITSAPSLIVEKISQDITGDPNALLVGDTLRYTITVRNIGNENTVNTILTDPIPFNTTYVTSTTTLNGVAVTDPVAGISALESGMLINSPENLGPGILRADANTPPVPDNIAVISFDVTVNAGVVNGTILSNQGTASGEGGGSGPFPDQLTDDPSTPTVPDDPTEDIVGDVPLLDVQKTVQIIFDDNTNGQLDPLDRIRYTITVTNTGVRDATNVVLRDAVPADTNYVLNSVFLNGQSVPDDPNPLPPPLTISPLIAGIDISSSDLTPPLPVDDSGTISVGQTATVIFDVEVNAAATPGTIISNQGFVSSNEIPTEPTDSDGDDSNGDQPTVIVVGNVQTLAITKQVTVVGGGPAVAGGQLEYFVTVTNIGAVPATNVVISDDLSDLSSPLDPPIPPRQANYVPGSALLNGSPLGTSFSALSVLTADYGATYGNLPVGQTAVLSFLVDIDAAMLIGDRITNIANVYWDTGLPPDSATATAIIDIGGTPGIANLHGQAWHDVNFDNIEAGERVLSGWTVELYSSGVLINSTLTDANGEYNFYSLLPNSSAVPYEIKFVAPGADLLNDTTASLGNTVSAFTNGPQTITDIVVLSGSNYIDQNLPIQPNGVVYNSILRTPVAGAALTLYLHNGFDGDGNILLGDIPDSCFADTNQKNQVTLVDGWYKFDLNFGTGCPAGADNYLIRVVQPSGFVGNPGEPSWIIPPITSAATTSFDVPSCPGSIDDAITATGSHCEAQISEYAPDTSVPARTAGTNYYLKLTLDDDLIPGHSQIFNNHIPLDPELDAAVAISKTTTMVNVTRGQLVPYTITVRNTLPVLLQDLNIIDTFPAGFKYVPGSGRLNGIATEPSINYNNRTLTWRDQTLDTDSTRTIQLLLVVGSGVSEGEYVNRAHVINNLTGENASLVAEETVRVIPDPTFDCSDVIGKVFNDENLNGYQDEGEKGIAGTRVMTARGLEATADAHGRFHITCAVVPNQDRGSNFILKLDERSLPTGFRLTTENPRVQRATRGKMLKYNFGAAIHRVVRLDMADGVFETDSTEMRPQWKPRIDVLLGALKREPSILRLSYMADIEDEDLVEDRLDAVKEDIEDRWQDLNCCYKLMIETETFWRRGGPRKRGGFD